MPQLKPAELDDDQIIQSDNVPFRERLFDRFKSHEFVRVKNIDDEVFEWQYFPSRGEEELKNQDGTHTLLGRRSFNADYSKVNRGNEEYWKMEPGAEEVLLGENALMFIEGLYKRIVAKRMIEKTPNTDRTRNFNWGNGNSQEELIDQIFQGIEAPQFDGRTHANAGTAKDAK